jgi:hypothetical protein
VTISFHQEKIKRKNPRTDSFDNIEENARKITRGRRRDEVKEGKKRAELTETP